MDIKTIIELLAIGNLTTTLLLYQYLRKNSNETARYHFISQVFFTIGFTSFALMQVLPKAIVITVGNTSLLFGAAFVAVAVSQLSERKIPHLKKVLISFAGVISAISIGLTVIINLSNIRIAMVTLSIALLWAMPAYQLLARKNKTYVQTGVGIIFLIVIFSALLRIREALNLDRIFDLYTPGLGQNLTFLGFFLYMVMSSSGIILLIKEQDDEKLSAGGIL